MSLVEFAANAIEITGLEIPAPRLARLIREAKGTAKELGARAARRVISERVKDWERVAVLNYLANSR